MLRVLIISDGDALILSLENEQGVGIWSSRYKEVVAEKYEDATTPPRPKLIYVSITFVKLRVLL